MIKKILTPLAAAGTLLFGAWFENYSVNKTAEKIYEPKKAYIEKIYSKENISKLEKEIKKEYSNLILAKSYETKNKENFIEEKAISLYFNEVKPELEKILNEKIKEPPIISRTGENNYAKLYFLIGLLGLFFCASSLKLSRKQAKKFFKYVFFLSAFAYSFYSGYFLSTAHRENYKGANFYDPGSKIISIEKSPAFNKKESLAIVIGHEVVHHLQDKYGLLNLNDHAIDEGEAREIEVELAKRLFAKTLNGNYAMQNLENAIGELKGIYLEACKRNGVKPDKFIEDIPIKNRHKIVLNYWLWKKELETPHAIGLALKRIEKYKI